MEPLDLTKHPPRSPRERLDGVVLVPRTIDKLRASLPGGNLGPYKIPGFSTRMLEMIGVREADLLEAVRRANSDEDVAKWLREHADTGKYKQVNEHFENLTTAGVKDPDDFHRRYPVAKKRELTNLFDVLEADDKAMWESEFL
ncbi:MAG TPA: DUF5069 domain-containing protein [Candidatus Eremiobacteraceae bacterium]|nr:DUF5069 domain-containing protein [Candidatus Eremiobacteraceae bacterium]